MSIRAVQLDVYRTAIAMRSFEHAAATRNQAEAVVVRAVFSDGVSGWGETLPRPYVTGETLESVVADLEGLIWPALAELDFSGVEAEVAAALAAIPTAGADGRCINAAACAAELACVDAHLKRRGLASPAGLLGVAEHPHPALRATLPRQGGGDHPHRPEGHLPRQGGGDHPHRPEGHHPRQGGGDAEETGSGSRDTQELAASTGWILPRVTGVLGSADAGKTARRLRLMRWYGLRDFKLKLGLGPAADSANLAIVRARLAGALAAGRCTLRVDVNGGWTADETPARVVELRAMGVCAVEQPVFCGASELVELARRCELPLIADESLLTDSDAEALLAEPAKVWWNIRISKNGGLVRTGRLSARAAAAGSTVVLGCMVGESGILSAAQRRLLQALGASVRFVEGNYGRLLLAGDIVRRSPRFGYGGRLSVLGGAGLGVEVDPARMARWARRVATLGR
jgi:L-alanine-DL-glutamate epimerase-like enolase superfamily enzyme